MQRRQGQRRGGDLCTLKQLLSALQQEPAADVAGGFSRREVLAAAFSSQKPSRETDRLTFAFITYH